MDTRHRFVAFGSQFLCAVNFAIAYRHDSEFDKGLLLAAGALSPKKNHHLNKDTYVVIKLIIFNVFNSRTHYLLFLYRFFKVLLSALGPQVSKSW